MRPFSIKYSNLLVVITRTQFKLKDQSTFLGFLWSFLNPLLIVAVLYVFFNFWIGASIKYYPIYLLIGVIQYNHFANSTSASMSVLSTMRHLTSGTVFPKEILVMGSVISSSIEFALEMGVMVLIAIMAGVTATWTWGLLPVIITLQIVLVLWGSLVLACVYVFVRDIMHIYQVFLRILFFMTPVFYDPNILGNGLAAQIVSLNPLSLLINYSREIMLGGIVPSPAGLMFFILTNTLLVGVAFWIFRRCEPSFAEYV